MFTLYIVSRVFCIMFQFEYDIIYPDIKMTFGCGILTGLCRT